MPERICTVCGAVFVSHRWQQQTCSKECSAEFKKRQDGARRARTREVLREKAAAKRAEKRKPLPPIPCATCGELFVPAKKSYKTCSPECRQTYKKVKRAEWYQDNREVSLARSAARRERNLEEVKAYGRIYYLANRPKMNAASRARYAADVEASREKHRVYNAKHRAKRRAEDPIQFRAYVNADNSKRRRASRQATPPWLTEADWAAIEAVYAEAARLTIETGVKHDADHRIALGSPNACGIHIAANLRAVPASENRSKHNAYDGPDAWPPDVVAEWIEQNPEFLNGLPRGWRQQRAA